MSIRVLLFIEETGQVTGRSCFWGGSRFWGGSDTESLREPRTRVGAEPGACSSPVRRESAGPSYVWRGASGLQCPSFIAMNRYPRP